MRFFLEQMQMFNANKQNCNKLTECMFYPIHPNVQSLLFQDSKFYTLECPRNPRNPRKNPNPNFQGGVGSGFN